MNSQDVTLLTMKPRTQTHVRLFTLLLFLIMLTTQLLDEEEVSPSLYMEILVVMCSKSMVVT